MKKKAKNLPSSVQSVISNHDLLTEILIRLPPLSLVLFRSVSKDWLSLIENANVPNLDLPSGLFLKKSTHTKYATPVSYDFVPLNIRIPVCRSSLLATKFTFGPKVQRSDVEILHSCNGLLLCRTFSGKLYVYNPSITNMFKVIPQPDNVTYYSFSGLKMAFDPTKSPHYKVIYCEIVRRKWVQIHTYSSETGNWSLCGHLFPHRVVYIENGVYWNDAICWLHYDPPEGEILKLDIMNDHPVLTALQTPVTLDGKSHYQCNLFESRGCLLLVGKDYDCSRHFTIYEKRSMYSEWSVKYIVNLDDIIKPFPEMWSRCCISRIIHCIVLEEREEDSFLVIELDKKVVNYKIMSKTLSTISNLGSNDVLFTCFQFIPSFANV